MKINSPLELDGQASSIGDLHHQIFCFFEKWRIRPNFCQSTKCEMANAAVGCPELGSPDTDLACWSAALPSDSCCSERILWTGQHRISKDLSKVVLLGQILTRLDIVLEQENLFFFM